MTGSDAALYLDLLKRSLLGLIDEDPAIRFTWDDSDPSTLVPFDRERGCAGRDWPSRARHDDRHAPARQPRAARSPTCSRAATPGDLIETGVWRGGATIFMRGVLKAHGVTDRTVWVADSFAERSRDRGPGRLGAVVRLAGMEEVRACMSGAVTPSGGVPGPPATCCGRDELRGGARAVRPLRAARRAGALPARVVPPHPAGRPDRAPGAAAPGRRPLRLDVRHARRAVPARLRPAAT